MEENDDSNNNRNSEINLYYSKSGLIINGIFKPIVSDAYAFVLSNRRSSIGHEAKTVKVNLIHDWQREITEVQLEDRPKDEECATVYFMPNIILLSA